LGLLQASWAQKKVRYFIHYSHRDISWTRLRIWYWRVRSQKSSL